MSRSSALRAIAVHVEEPEPGQFVWVLTERSGRDWEDLGRADAVTSRYQQAMADGLLALQSMVEDLDAGPRVPGVPTERERRSPRRAESTPARPAERTSRKTFFGFGPAR